MTPAEFNALCEALVLVLNSLPDVRSAELITRADDGGAAPELALTFQDVELALEVTPL